MRVLCVTPNVSVDRTLEVPGFAAGGVWRAARVAAVCGGKGVNVARAARALGHEAGCAGLIGGHTGRLAAESAESEGLEAAWTRFAGESRTCVIVVGSGEATVVNEPGAEIGADDWRRLVDDVADAPADAVCVSGSLPPGTPTGGLADLVAAAGRDRPVWVDTNGSALAEAIAARPFGVKVNGDEAGAILGFKISRMRDAIESTRELRERGLAAVAITLGAAGAVLATADGAWRAVPPTVPVVSAVGSGDCFLAGLATAFGSGCDGAEALALATAAGAANATQPTAGRIDSADLAGILAAVTVERAD